MTQIDFRGGRSVLVGEGTPKFVLVPGVPVSAPLFRKVQERLLPHASLALDLEVPDTAPEQVLATMGDALSDILLEVGTPCVYLHGSAAPLAFALRPGSAQHIIVGNGPLRRPGPLFGALSRLPDAVLSKILLKPELLSRWLRSSAGLRRLVTNPYAMHHDIVVMLSERWTSSAEGRAAASRWIRAFAHPLPQQIDPLARFGAVWGDHDPLHPMAEVEAVSRGWAQVEVTRVPGGRMFFVEERPWAVAEALIALVDEG